MYIISDVSPCAYLGLFLGGSPRLRQQKRRCDCNCTVHSSVQTTRLKSRSTFSRAHASLFSLFAWRINWQYALPRNVHPKEVLQRKTVRREILIPCVFRSSWSWYAVVSSSRRICCSTKRLTSRVTFDGLPDPGRLTMEPVS